MQQNVYRCSVKGQGCLHVGLTAKQNQAQAIAPAVPTYWAMEGFRAVTMEPGGMADVAGPVAVLLGFSAVFLAVAVNRFAVEDTKVSWA